MTKSQATLSHLYFYGSKKPLLGPFTILKLFYVLLELGVQN